jgi:hypothetical protein
VEIKDLFNEQTVGNLAVAVQVACGACTKRYPFGVDMLARMQQAISMFEA